MAAAKDKVKDQGWPNRQALMIALALLVLVSAITAATIPDYGITYDEPHYVGGGLRYAQWLGQVLGGDVSALGEQGVDLGWSYNHEHPALPKLLFGISQSLFGSVWDWASRLPTALLFGALVGAIFLSVAPIWGRAAGLFAALALATMPRVFAHAHLAALDLPVTAFFFATTVVFAEAIRRNRWGWAVASGILFGLALLSKVNAFFLPVFLIPWAAIFHRKSLPKGLVALLVVGPLVCWAGWPWMWYHSAERLRDYLAFQGAHYPVNVWYLGKINRYAPWHYPLVITLVTTPLPVLALGLAGLVDCWRRVDDRKLLLALGAAVPLLASSLPSSPKYNGVRLFLPAFPFIAALAGGGFGWLWGWLRERIPPAGSQRPLAAGMLGLILLLPGLAGTISTHPFQLAYYNGLVGGVRGAQARGFETIYWGQVYLDGAAFLNSQAPRDPLVYVTPLGCVSLLQFWQRSGVLDRRVRMTGDPRQAPQADWVVFQCAQSELDPISWPLYRKGRPIREGSIFLDGIPLFEVFSREEARRVLGPGPW